MWWQRQLEVVTTLVASRFSGGVVLWPLWRRLMSFEIQSWRWSSVLDSYFFFFFFFLRHGISVLMMQLRRAPLSTTEEENYQFQAPVRVRKSNSHIKLILIRLALPNKPWKVTFSKYIMFKIYLQNNFLDTSQILLHIFQTF